MWFPNAYSVVSKLYRMSHCNEWYDDDIDECLSGLWIFISLLIKLYQKIEHYNV